MKLSNKILIGFFGFLFLYLTAVFAEVRFRGTPVVIDQSNSIAETVDIAGVSYLVLDDLDQNIHVSVSDRPRLEVRSFSGNLLQHVTYRFSGDTLTLSRLESEKNRSIKITVFVSEAGLKGMTLKSAVAIVEGLRQDRFSISQNAGRMWMSDNNIGILQIRASDDSFLDITASNLDTLAAEIEGSELVVSSPIGLLRGSMKDGSSVRVTDHIQEIQFKKDESCNLSLYR